MACVKDILAVKGSGVLSIEPDASVLQAAQLMNHHKVGALVVIERNQVRGMFTERDILRRIVAEGRNPNDTLVRDVMTREIVVCRSETPIEEARAVMRTRRIRHLPVLDESARLAGLVSIGDLNAWEADCKELTIHFLHEYIYGQT